MSRVSAIQLRTLQRMRGAVRNWMAETRDIGLLPEDEIHGRAVDSTPYQVGHNPDRYPMGQVLKTADEASSREAEHTPALVRKLSDSDSALRYWAALGLLMRGEAAVQKAEGDLRTLLEDRAPAVKAAAAEALGRYGGEADRKRALAVLMELAPADRNGIYVAIQALNAISAMGPHAAPARDAIAQLPSTDPKAHQRLSSYVPNLIKKLVSDLS
jgi:uncharacterized sulfatase